MNFFAVWGGGGGVGYENFSDVQYENNNRKKLK